MTKGKKVFASLLVVLVGYAVWMQTYSFVPYRVYRYKQ